VFFLEQDTEWMKQSLALARQGQYSAKPNPSVGCVIVKNGELIGEGWHKQAGQAHAEVNALADAGSKAVGATAYVTLEPCSHTGRTGPCAVALVEAKVSRVVIAMKDPNPLVAGKGIEILKVAGIELAVGLLEAEAIELNKNFCQRMKTTRPRVFSKVAMSLDGRTAMASGESKWITGAEARRDVHRLRAESCAVLTGIATVLADDPELTARDDVDGLVVQPVRIVLDSALKTPITANIIGEQGSCRILTCSEDVAKKQALEAKGCVVIKLPSDKGLVDLQAAFDWLAEQNLNSVMVEAGNTLNGALLEAGLLDELVMYVAPCIMGNQAKGTFSLPTLDKMADRKMLSLNNSKQLGDDLRLSYTIIKP